MKYRLEKVSNYMLKDYELPSYIKNKIRNYKRDNRKKQSLIGYELVYEMLLNKSVKNIDFYLNQFGKPYLKDNNIYFNISHSHDYVIAVTSNKEVGVDIQKIGEINSNSINRFATLKEKEYIMSFSENIKRRYFLIYSLKESYFKMLGKNLDNMLDVEFEIDSDKVICSDSRCDAFILDLLNDYVITICEKK